MKFLLSVITIALLCWLTELIMPWWAVAVVPFLVSLFAGYRSGRSFLMGFCGVGLCWFIVAIMHDIPNEHILSTKMASIFSLSGYKMFILVSVFIGALIGGMSAATGSLLKAKSR